MRGERAPERERGVARTAGGKRVYIRLEDQEARYCYDEAGTGNSVLLTVLNYRYVLNPTKQIIYVRQRS